ncbi:MAG: DctP family TRAP transporter solute-binding subunit [Uliginosibacterium sp.]|nr:DctP family TRAP transporter solute-binding subunit [Uliginosibacterium sp.]
MRKPLLGLVVFSFLLTGTPSARAEQQIVLKFSHVTTADTPKGRAAEFFKMRAEGLTKGRVKVEVYPNSQLFKDAEEFDALAKGQVQMLAPTLGKVSSLGFREFEIFDIPYLFPTKASLQRVQDGPIGKGLLKRLESKGFLGIAYWDNGFKIMSANRPLLAPADMRGLKVRIQNSKMVDMQMRALGAVPQVLALNEAFQALQSGILDGTENPPSNMYTQKMYEVQKYAVDTNHGYLGYAVVTNKKFWDELPADVRTLLEQALRDATRYANAISQQDNDDALAVIERSGKTRVAHLSDTQRKAWRQALAPVQKEAEARVGTDLIKAINKEVAILGGG